MQYFWCTIYTISFIYIFIETKMCLWTKIKKVSWYAGSVMVIIALITAIMSYVWGKAIAQERVDTLREERTTKVGEMQSIKDCIAEIKTDMAVVKNDTTWIKEHLKSQ